MSEIANLKSLFSTYGDRKRIIKLIGGFRRIKKQLFGIIFRISKTKTPNKDSKINNFQLAMRRNLLIQFLQEFDPRNITI